MASRKDESTQSATSGNDVQASLIPVRKDDTPEQKLALQAMYLTAGGTLTQFNAIVVAILAGGVSTAENATLRTLSAVAMMLHVLAALILCWSGRPVVPQAVRYRFGGRQQYVEDTFRNFRRGWRTTLLALVASALVAIYFVAQATGVLPAVLR